MKKSCVWMWVFVVSCLCTGGLVAQQTDPDLTVSANNPPAASQPVPRLIMFSGTLKDLSGKPLTGPVDLNFAIYKEQTDAAPLWQESQTLNLDEQGRYTALLGAMQAEGLPVDLFTSGEARWLGVSVGKLPEQPRVLLVSVPYALKANDAEMLAGKPASAYMLAPAGESGTSQGPGTPGAAGPRKPTTPDMATPGKPKSGPKPNVTGGGTPNCVPLWTDSAGTLGTSVICQSGSNIGIGTTTPGYKLDVVGGSARVTNPTGTTQLTVSGSASSGRLGQDAAGFFFSSDTNGAALRFGTNNGSGHEWMRITSAGNIGIATTAPTQPLDVAGNINSRANVTATGSVTAASFTGSGAGLTTLNASNLASGTVPSARISGTYSNALTFSSASNSFAGNGAGLTNVAAATAATATTASGLSCTGCVGNSQLGVNYATSTSQGGAASNALLLNGLASSAFQPAGSYAVTTGPNSFTGNQTVSGGNVGIGTTTPVSALNVAGTTGLTWTGGGNNLGLATFGTPGTGGSLYVNTTSGSSTYQSGLGIDGTYGTPPLQSVINLKALGVNSGGGYGSQLAFWTTNGTASKQQMTIDMAGNVGIGTTTPAATLEVNGTAKFDGAVTFAGGETTTGNISTSSQLISTVATGTAPLSVASTTLVPNLNADLLDGLHASAFQPVGAYATLGANTFTASQTISSGDLSLPQTTGATTGVINLGGSPFLHACCSATQDNTFVGSYAGNFSTTGKYNTASGYGALYLNTTGYDNAASGYEALFSDTTGGGNTASGYRALYLDTTGSYNTASGWLALLSNTSGTENTANGDEALYQNTTGSYNTASGEYALSSNTSGYYNTANGTLALASNSTGQYNTAVGYQAGVTANSAYANTTGSNNTFIGYKTGPGTSTQLNNATAIGAGALVSASNALVLGGTGAYAVNVGIGTTTPAAKLDVAGSGNFVTSAGTALVANNAAGGKIFSGQNNGVEKLGVDGSGNVRANAYFDLAGNPIGVSTGNGGIGGVTVAAAFVQVVHTNISGGNICYGIGGQTIIDNPLTNDHPNALLIVTANWGALSSFAAGSGVQSVTYDDLGACALNHWLVNPDVAFADNQKLNILVMIP